MSHSITITSADPSDRDGKFSIPAGIENIRASGHLSNAVIVGREIKPDATPPVGPVEVRKSFGGGIVVSAGELEMSLAEAQSLGLVDNDGQPTQRTNVEASSETPQGSTNRAGDPASSDLPTVDAAELQAHAREINAAGDAFERAGLNAEDALSRSVASIAKGEALPEDVSEALIGAMGEDGASALLSNAFHHAQVRALDAAKMAGVNLSDPATVAALDAHLRAADLSVWINALRGNPSALNHHVARFAVARR